MMANGSTLYGKRVLVLGGSPREVIDGVRHYLNVGRDHSHGVRVANALAGLGASVTLVTVKSSSLDRAVSLRVIDSVGGRKIVSARDLLDACGCLVSERYDAVVQMANVSSIVPARPSDRKLKVKGEAGGSVSLDVIGNVDVVGRLRDLFPSSVVVGYDNRQRWQVGGDEATSRAIRTLADRCPDRAIPRSPLPPGSATGGIDLSGRKVVVTSGPTAEPITVSGDVVTNFSSGRQGHAVAEALSDMGADVVLVSGPTSIAAPVNGRIRTVRVGSAREMLDAVVAELPSDVFVGVAAVADFGMGELTVLSPEDGELHTLRLVENPDILQAVGTHPTLRPSVVVGFAAETHDLLAYARGKLIRKGADFICANQVGEETAARDPGLNSIVFVTSSGHEELPETSKLEIGRSIGLKVARLLATESPHP